MNYNVRILPTAWEDLKKIEDWYVLKFDVDTALNVSNHILDSIDNLSSFPDIGSLTPDVWLNAQGYRMIICELQVIIYRQIGSDVFVYHIADTRTDYIKLFGR